MFRYIRITFLLLLLAATAAHSQEVVTFSGRVLNEDNGLPVPGHTVYVSANDSLLLNFYITDQNGFFYDSLWLAGFSVDYLTFATFDCLLNTHDTAVYNLLDNIFVEFIICTDSIPVDCQANFFMYPYGSDPMTMQFEDNSLGDYDHWYWDFGDSTFSQEQNPLHTFNEPGDYMVCLTISSNNGPCNSTWCQPVVVFNPECEAGFTYVLDSLSSDPNLYLFTDQSAGEINSWFWDFGDGNISFEQNPVHQYADSGQYLVCLTVSSDSVPALCNDTYCQQITTPAYHDFGGLVWAGDYPLNNPVFANDTGRVHLYRLYEEKWYFKESKLFHENGYYWFAGTLEGKYLVKVELTTGSPSYPNYIPTYFSDQVNWGAAQVIDLNESSYEKHIHLAPTQPLPYGPGTISGNLVFEGNEPASKEGVHIILSSIENQPLEFASSDAPGNFIFSNLPLGTYLVRADFTGHLSETDTIILTSVNPANNTVELVVDEQAFYGISETPPHPSVSARIYPIPAGDRINLEILSDGDIHAYISIVDITGKSLLSMSSYFREVKQVQTFDVSALPQGLYLVKIETADPSAPVIIKFIK